MHWVLIRTRRRQHHLVIYSEVDAGLVLVVTAADQEGDVIPLDGERAAHQLARRPVLLLDRIARSARMAVGDPLTLSVNVTLVGRDLRNLHRPRAESGARHRPVGISLTLEILEDRVGPLRSLARRHIFCAAFQEQQVVVAHQAIAPHAALGFGGMQANRVLQPAGQFGFDVCGAVVLDRELHHRGGQRRIIRIERDKWRKGFESYVQRRGRVLVFDVANRIFASEGDVAPVLAIQRAILGLAVGYDPQCESLLQRRSGLQRFGVMLRPSPDPGVEQVPMPELAVAAQVELSGADAAHRHPDLRQVRPAIHLALAARGQRLDPLRRQFLVCGDELVEIRPRERPGHAELPRVKSQRGPSPDEFQKVAPPKAADRGMAVAGGMLVVKQVTLHGKSFGMAGQTVKA